MFFLFESQPFFCNDNGFCARAAPCANTEGDGANLSRHWGVVAAVPDPLGQFQARDLPVLIFLVKLNRQHATVMSM